jgi:hypothetical protein
MTTLYLVAIAILLVGAGIAWWGWGNYKRQGAQHADASARWQKTQGTVVDARIIERERSDSNDNDYTVYEPRLRYSYVAGGGTHESERIALCSAPSYSDVDEAGRWLTAHAPGSKIDIWYDPAKPAESACTLDKPSLFGAIMTALVGVGLAGMGVWMLTMIPGTAA